MLAGPVLDIRPVAVSRPAGRPDALVFTSAHAVRHHPLEPGWWGIPVYTVGDRTAEAAQRSGYRLIRSANGDVDDLQRLIRRTLPVSSRLFHFGARQTAGDLCGELVSVGYRASKHVVYEAAPTARACVPVEAGVEHRADPGRSSDGRWDCRSLAAGCVPGGSARERR